MAIGLFISSLTDSQSVAAIISILVLLMMWLVSWMASGASGPTRDVLMYLSAQEHFFSFIKGIFDLKDVVYYLSFITFGLLLTHQSVESQRWRA
jgi:ABC-2 type transport system permease protein